MIALTPWAAAQLSVEDRRQISARAVSLHVNVRVGGKSPGGPWTVRVHSWSSPVRTAEIPSRRGMVPHLMHLALDEYERRFVFTPDELAQVQRQSA